MDMLKRSLLVAVPTFIHIENIAISLFLNIHLSEHKCEHKCAFLKQYKRTFCPKQDFIHC